MQLPSPVRLLGIDLGITSDHTAVVVDDAGSICARRRARSTVASLAALEAAALATAPLGAQLVVVIEPTGPAWLPVAVFFGRRGHTVLRVTSAKAADLRRFLARHAKSNSIDAETLARLPLVAPTGLTAVEFGSPARASLDRRVRAVARLTAEIGRLESALEDATLARLLKHGLVEVDAIEPGAGPERKRYAITAAGVTDVERWLGEPEKPEPYLQSTLYAKVVLVLMTGRRAEALLDAQRAEHLRLMRELTRRKRAGDSADQLICDHALFHLEADLRWLELTAARLDQLAEEVLP